MMSTKVGLTLTISTYSTSPQKAYLEQYQTCHEQRCSNVVEHLHLLGLRAYAMFHAERGWVIKENIQQAGEDVESNQ